MEQRAFAPGALIRGGLVAGSVGAITIGLYLIATVVYAFHAATPATFFRYIASAAIGKIAYTAPGAVGLGVALHVFISLAWTLGYAYVAAQNPQVRLRPFTSGIVFGIFVMIAMQLGEVLANIYALPDSLTLLNQFIAHVFFFGIPIAYIVRRTTPA